MMHDIPVNQAELVEIRRELHMHPELRWELQRTSALVRRKLDELGVSYEAGKYGPHTVVATLGPQDAPFTIALRADMDALPITEENRDKPYRSQNEGVMHACGHDAHTAMLLGTARALKALEGQLRCRVKLLFQPCEEGRPSGARTMCEHGVMDGIDAIAMCHVNCGDPTHVVSCCPGVTNATSVAFEVKITGRSAHVACPHLGVDALAMGVRVYEGIQLMLTRGLDPFDTCAMTVCTMKAGTSNAVNADECVLTGSIRCMKEKTMQWARARLTALAESVCADMGGGCEVTWSGEPLPVAHNDPALYEALTESAKRVVGEARVKLLLPSTGAEDFAYYEREKPGVLFGLGMRNVEKGACHPAHTRDWDIDEDGLETGVRVFVQFVLDHMDGIPGMKYPEAQEPARKPPVFYCQLDYEHVPYPSPTSPNGNLADNGCGVMCASMVAENLMGLTFPPEESAKLAKACGAREGFGTDLYIYAPAFAEHAGLCVRDTEDAGEALRFLQEGRGMVIANVAGDRKDGYVGVFATSGHYIVLAGAEGNTVRVWDPMYRPGRYDIPGRAGKVRMEGNEAFADISVIAEDCRNRPYFLFWPKEAKQA